jgi:hypothetical protein
MTSTSTLRRRITRTAAVALAAVGMGAALSASPANASIGVATGELYVTDYKPGYHNVAVFGKVRMSKAEAQTLINQGYKVQLRLWGEDTFSDDLLMGPYPATIYATDNGLEFHKVHLGISDTLLDEDWEGRDELYVGIRLVNRSGATLRSTETNRVNGYF